MLNASDALGLQEDLAIVRANQNRIEAAAMTTDARREADENSLAMRSAASALRANKDVISGLRSELDSLMNSRNDQVAVTKATKDVLNALISKLADATDTPVEQLRGQVNSALSRRYDHHVSDMLEGGFINRDLRKDRDVMEKRDWYVPAP